MTLDCSSTSTVLAWFPMDRRCEPRRLEVAAHFRRSGEMRFDFRKHLQSIRCPVLIMAGLLDPMVTIDDARELATALRPKQLKSSNSRTPATCSLSRNQRRLSTQSRNSSWRDLDGGGGNRTRATFQSDSSISPTFRTLSVVVQNAFAADFHSRRRCPMSSARSSSLPSSSTRRSDGSARR